MTDQNAAALAAYGAYCDADTAWSRAIAREFPTEHPGDVRYTKRAHGVPGSNLNFLYLDYVAKREAFDLHRAVFFNVTL